MRTFPARGQTVRLLLLPLLLPLLFLFHLTATGCSRKTVDRHHRFRITTEDNITAAVTTGGPKFEGELFRYEHILTLQEDEEQAESLLTRPSIFSRDENGDYYVVDSTQKRIVVFDHNGRYARSFGRLGEGPGEFRYLMLQYVRNGIISIWDYITSRTTCFSTDGRIIDIYTKPVDFAYVPRGLLPIDGGGLMAFRPFAVASDSTQVEVATYDAAGRRIATLKNPMLLEMVAIRNTNGQVTRTQMPYAPIPTAAYRPGRGILISPGHEPVLEWYDITGNMTARIEVRCLETVLTEADRERHRRLWESRLEQYPERREMIHVYGDPSLLPETAPPWTFIYIDDAGFYWLRAHDPVYQDYAFTEGYRYHLLSPEGEYLGTTRSPPEQFPDEGQCHLIPVSVAHGFYMGISDDAKTGGKLLQVFRLIPAVSGFRYP